MKKLLEEKLFVKILGISILLIALSIFYKFVAEPIYFRYKLSTCLSTIEKRVEVVRAEECTKEKTTLLNYCLHDAQSFLYCKDKMNHHRAAGLFGSFDECKVPDNSAGFWDENVEYQKLSQKCEQINKNTSCKDALGNSLDDAESNYRSKEEAICFKRY